MSCDYTDYSSDSERLGEASGPEEEPPLESVDFEVHLYYIVTLAVVCYNYVTK